MADRLDDLVSAVKQHYEDQRIKDEAFLEEQKLKKALGATFFKDVKAWLKSNGEKFNKKFGSEVFTVEDDLPNMAFNVRSQPDTKHTWTAVVTYIPESHKIEINRSPGGPTAYSLALVPQENRIVALYGNNTGVENGFNAELLGENIMRMMFLP
jgi:hypothetical protein